MKYIESDYVVFITSSKQHFWVWCVLSLIIHITVGIILIRLTLPNEIVIITTLLSYVISVVLGIKTQQSNYQLRITERGDLRYKEHVNFNGKLLISSFSTGWFIWCCFGSEFDKKIIRLLIWQDAVDSESFRRLSRIIRLKRRMI